MSTPQNENLPMLEPQNSDSEPAPIVEPLLADPSLQEFPTTFTRSKTKHGSDKYLLTVEGGSVDAYARPGSEVVALGDLNVDPQFDGQGRGTYLVRALGREMAARGYKELTSIIVNPIAMRNRDRIFGPEKTRLKQLAPTQLWREADEAGNLQVPVISTAQAAASLERVSARRHMREKMGRDPYSAAEVEDSTAWEGSVDLTDPEVLAYLNNPPAWKESAKVPRIVPADERHYPPEWEDEARAHAQALREQARAVRPSLGERFASARQKLREKTRGLGRKVALAMGTGAVALTLLANPTAENESGSPAAQSAASQEAAPGNAPAAPTDHDHQAGTEKIPESGTPTLQDTFESVTVGPYNSRTGAGTLWHTAKQKLAAQTDHKVTPQEITAYVDEIKHANPNIKEPRHLQPSDVITLPPLHQKR